MPQLLHRFSSSKGYTLYPDVLPFFRQLRRKKQKDSAPRSGLIVGIITNSDDRVPSILSSLGLSVGPLKLGGAQWDPTQVESLGRKSKDIDFVALSYDIGFEKPDSRIFDTVRKLIRQTKGDDCELLHVGDDLEKDVNGAKAAGWGSLLLDREEKYVDVPVNRIRDLENLKKLLDWMNEWL